MTLTRSVGADERHARLSTVELKRSKTELAHHWMRSQILEGRFVPGYRLVISQLAKEMGTSIGPIREAIRLLEAEGFVRFEPNVGAQVALRSESEYHDRMQALAILEAAATRLALPHITDAQLVSAKATNRAMAASLQELDPERMTALNHEFHALLFGACPNEVILGSVEREWQHIEHLRLSSFGFAPERAQESVREHDELIALIEAGAEPWTVERFAREHRLNTLAAVRSHGR